MNSMGEDAYEAEVELAGGIVGIASSPVAIEPGRREKRTTEKEFSFLVLDQMKECFFDQETLDAYLKSYIDELGSDITLAVSMAFARAFSRFQKISLVGYLRKLIGINEQSRDVMPLVPIFSGGIHAPDLGGSMQQMMLSVKNLDFGRAVHVIRAMYHDAGQFLVKNNLLKGLAASSGFLVRGLTVDEEFAFLDKIIKESRWKDNLSIAIDVAAEHLWKNGKYRFYNKLYSPKEFEDLLYFYMEKYPISIIEDPFDYHDEKNWRSLYNRIGSNAEILSDDYSATQIQYLNSSIADGIIIKMKQVGTLTDTLMLVSKIKSIGLKICVSHRSCETEDTFICDLAVAIASDYIKIGAPCRGDRVEKYNQLIRLYGISL